MTTPTPEVEAAADLLTTDLAHSVPITLEGEHGWYAVAERVLAAARQVSGEA